MGDGLSLHDLPTQIPAGLGFTLMHERPPSPDRPWNERWATAQDQRTEPRALLVEARHLLPANGSAVDLAGGPGTDACWLAGHGLTTTLIDASSVACTQAAERARSLGVELDTIVADLETDPIPGGPYDVIHIANYLHRPMLGTVADALNPGGLLLMTVATTHNLERHDRPPRPFLVEPGELPALVPTLEPLRFDEAWRDNGRHEARLIARR